MIGVLSEFLTSIDKIKGKEGPLKMNLNSAANPSMDLYKKFYDCKDVLSLLSK